MLQRLSDLLWGPGTLALLLGAGLFLTLRLRFLPWRRLPYALRSALGREARQAGPGELSPFSALMTALAGTIGTGNIVGVAAALAAGGPGALVWMELSALLGMATLFTEGLLCAKYRRKGPDGRRTGGPMAVMEAAFGPRFGTALGKLFSLFALSAAFCMGGMAQASAITESMHGAFGLSRGATALAAVLLLLPGILGGVRGISRVTSVLVPAMALLYLGAGLAVILGNLRSLPAALVLILRSALSPGAAAGGMAGGFAALRWGVARGVFSNEAGLGTAGIAAASAGGTDPVRQGCITMTGAFFDTLVICTVTGLAVCCSGALEAGTADGAALVLLAFRSVLGDLGERWVAVSVALFALSTILGWAFQGETVFSYLTGGRGRFLFRPVFVLAVLWGAGRDPGTAYCLADICNALMCVPNLLCLLAMSGEAARLAGVSRRRRRSGARLCLRRS